MEGIHRQLLAESTTGDVVGPFFGFMGAAAALVFACESHLWVIISKDTLAAESLHILLPAPPSLCDFRHEMIPRCSSIYKYIRRHTSRCQINVCCRHGLSDAGFGAAYGTAKSGVGIASMGVMRPELVMKSIVPVVMAGVLGIYGLIIAVIISTGSKWLSCCLSAFGG